jgi:acylpyruvate hydrolase
MRAEIPTSPVFFLKPATALIPDGGTVLIPPISHECHHEVELTVLLGKSGKNIPAERAMEYVAGYGVGLDMTLRDVQDEAKKKGLPWSAAKGFDTSAPVSEFLPASQIVDPHALEVELRVNGRQRQRSSTSRFIFQIPALLAYLSRILTLERGDIVFTGTPEGVSRVVSGDLLEASLRDGSGATLVSLTARIG